MENQSHGSVLQAERPLGGQVIQGAHIQILKAAPNF